MREATVKVYQFSELSPKAKQKAIEWYQRASDGDKWWDSVYEDAKNIGLEITGFDVGRGQECEGKFLHGALESAHKIEKDHGEGTDTYTTTKTFLKERDEIVFTAPRDENGEFENEYELDRKLNECEADYLKSILEDYRVMLSNEYEHINSEETIIENIEANEYEFTEDGKRF